jgi:glycolate oxidase FAD binding subunit
MPDLIKPRDQKDVAAAVEWALAGGKTLEIVGGGSKREIGRAAQWDLTLDLSGLSGVTLYEPEELVLSAKAGTPLSEIEQLVASRGQELAFEPMDYGPVLGRSMGRGTLGGALATNLSGPRRIKAGAARDHFLGATAVSGRAEVFKSGGRVVKNVTGYDLCKLLAGSWGTLAAMTDVTIKVLPRAATEESLLVLGLDDRKAVAAMAAAVGSSADVSGAAHLPANIAARILGAAAAGSAVTAFRLEGVPPSIAQRKELLERLLRPYGVMLMIREAGSRAVWQAVRDAAAFAAADGENRSLWRVSTAPTRGPEVAAKIPSEAEAELFYDWAGGLVWITLPPLDDAGAALVRGAVRAAGGHATLVRAPASVRAAIDVFEPQPEALAALTRRVKESFDPKRVLGPGRMYAGV